MTNVIVSKRNDTNVSMIENVFMKKKLKRVEMNVNIGNNSWEIAIV